MIDQLKFYIATSLENVVGHHAIRNVLLERGLILTYDWTTHGTAWPRGSAYVRNVIRAEQAGVRDADFVIVLLPGGKGTHVELGMALALNKPVLLVGDPADKDPLSFLRCEGPFCGFWISDGVSHYVDAQELLTCYWCNPVAKVSKVSKVSK